MHSNGIKKGMSRYGNDTKESLDFDHNIEAKITKEEEYSTVQQSAQRQVNPIAFSNPGDVDEGIWEKAKKEAEKEYGKGHWGAVSYIYEKMGGKFHRKS